MKLDCIYFFRLEYGHYWMPNNMIITYEGVARTVGNLNYMTPCQIDYTFWPWDVQVSIRNIFVKKKPPKSFLEPSLLPPTSCPQICEVFLATDTKAENGSSVIALGDIGQDLKVSRVNATNSLES